MSPPEMPQPTDAEVDAVREAMQEAWNTFCYDAEAHPDCFYREGRKLFADFQRGNYARMVASALASKNISQHRAAVPDMWSERHDPESVGCDPSEWAAEGRIEPGDIREVTPWVALKNEWLACRRDEEGTEQSEVFATREEAEAWIAAAPPPPAPSQEPRHDG